MEDRHKDRLRSEILSSAKRVIIKVGSGVLTAQNDLNTEIIEDLAEDICELKRGGREFIIVSSGAIAAGLKKLGLKKRPQSISQLQALAAIGQGTLIMSYEEAFERFKQKVSQILITRDDFNSRLRYLNARNTIFTLLTWGVIPIINENDTVAVDEIRFGDNDTLSAMIANMVKAQLLINLTDIDGLFDRDPRRDPDARLIEYVDDINRNILQYASNIPGFLGSGGMHAKIKAIGRVMISGIHAIIANGKKRNILKRLFRGEPEGTLFLGSQQKGFSGRKHWIAFGRIPKGKIFVDSGAERAILKGFKSLLPSGVQGVKGKFYRGDTAFILNNVEKVIGVGIVNYDSKEIEKIKGLRSDEIDRVLGYKSEDEIIHRDNMVIFNEKDRGASGICQLIG